MRVQTFIGAAGLAAAFTVGSIALSAQTPAPQSGAPKPATTAPSGSMKQTPAAATASSDDTAFVQKAAEGGMKEVEVGKAVASKASNAQVKAFANRLVKDHGAANQQLMAIAKRHNIETPASAPAGNEPWMSQTGAAYDKGFIDAQVKDHQEDIALFEKEAKGGSDKEIKAFAARQLPTLRAHLKQAQNLQSKLGASTH